jgi:anti-sigma B factor antagonist
MSSSNNRVWVGTSEGCALLRVEGRATHVGSAAVRQVLSELLQRSYLQFDVDLAACTYLDSTFLGVLAELGLRLKDRAGLVTISHASRDKFEMFRTLGIAPLFHFRGGDVPKQVSAELAELPCSKLSRRHWARTLIDAHRALIEANSANAPLFKDVLQFLNEDLVRRQHTVEPLQTEAPGEGQWKH